MMGRRGAFRWHEVKRIRYATMMKWFKLELQSGETVRISAMLMGLPEFASLALCHVPAAAIDKETRSVLEATAIGHLPSLSK